MLALFKRIAPLCFLLALALGAPTAGAQGISLGRQVTVPPSEPAATSFVTDRVVKGVEVEATYNWPDQLCRGFFPLTIRLANGNEDSTVVDLVAETPWATEDTVSRQVMLGPGQAAEFEMLLRAREIGINNYALKIKVGGEESRMDNCGPTGRRTNRRGNARQNVMVVSAAEPPLGTQETLTEEWIELDSKTNWTSLGERFLLSTRTFAQLSTDWQAYTSLDTVILDLSVGELPSVPLLEALIAWCRSGGTLVVLGGSAEAVANYPALGSAVEERFEQIPQARSGESGDPFSPSSQAFQEKGLVAYRVGFGTLIASRHGSHPNGVVGADGQGLSLAYVASRAGFPDAWHRDSRTGTSEQRKVEDLLEKFADLPLRTLMVFMVLISLLLGPANFLWVKRKKKPMLLLVSVPTIAFASSVVLLLYGLFAQGLEVRSVTRTWAVLDQRTQQATTNEVRRVFAGSSPGEGLRPEVGTMVFPGADQSRGSYRMNNRFVADSSDGLVLSGDYFPVRNAFAQMIVSNRTSRLRLEAKQVGEELQVTNALGTNIRRLLLRGARGNYHALGAPLAPGESATLVLTGGADKLREWGEDVALLGGTNGLRMMVGTYLAELEEAPLRDDCGVEVVEVEGRHVLLGILDTNEGAF